MGNDQSKAYSIKLTEKNRLGKGTYGTVYKITKKDTQTLCAAKIFNVPCKEMKDIDQHDYKKELEILKETSHPFVLKYIEEFTY